MVCQNPITWNSSSDWVTNTNQISIRLKSSEIKALDYYATQHAQSKISIEYTDVTEMEVETIESVLDVPAMVGTVNFGSPYVGSGCIATDQGAWAGSQTTGPELNRIEDALGLI